MTLIFYKESWDHNGLQGLIWSCIRVLRSLLLDLFIFEQNSRFPAVSQTVNGSSLFSFHRGVAWRRQPFLTSRRYLIHPYRRCRTPHRMLHQRTRHLIQDFRVYLARISWFPIYRGHHSCQRHRYPRFGR